MFPAITGSGESDFVIDRSASVFSVVVSVAELLPGVGSEVVALTVALFERSVVRDEFTFTVSVRDVLAPLARPPIAQVTVPAASDPPPEADAKLVPAGIASEMLTPAASDGPLFMMPIV